MMQKKPFTELGLSPETLKAVERMGFEEATPIQSVAIPVLLGGRDLVGQSQTGSGKTAAFAIPAIEKVDPQQKTVQALILCPTRELAMQVAEEVAKLASFKRGVRELPIYGGASYERQFRGLHEGAQIVIGTPGRVIDHLDRKSLVLDHLKMLVLDECDRMLDMGFREDIERILASSPAERQTAFFSATMPKPIRDLINQFSREPEHLKIESATVSAPAIDQVYYEVDRRSKVEVLCRLIDIQDVKFGLIFCATKLMCDELTDQLNARGYEADKLHGDMSQQMRERVMARFRDHKVELLVATDVAARGLDVDDIEVVFNYDLPQDAEDYVHRIGRTGRAGRAGRAITFIAGREVWKLQQIQRYTRSNIRREKVPTIDELEEKRSSAFLDSLRETLRKAEYKRYDQTIDQLLDAGNSATDICSALMHLLSQETVREPQIILEDEPERPRQPYPKYQPRLGETGGGYRNEGPPRREYQQDRPPRTYPPRGGGYGPPREERPRPYGNRDDRSYPPRPAQDRPTGERPLPAKPYGRPPFRKKPYGKETGGFYERSPGRKRPWQKGDVEK